MFDNCPVTLEEIKNHLHILSEDFDQTLWMNLRAATAAAESYIGRNIIRRVVNMSMPFSKTFTVADYSTVENVTVDGGDVEYTQVNNKVTLLVDNGKVVRCDVISGWLPEECPMDIKMAIMLMAAKYFNNPVDSVEQLPKASTSLLKPFKNYMI